MYVYQSILYMNCTCISLYICIWKNIPRNNSKYVNMLYTCIQNMLSLSLVKKNNLDKIKQILTKFNLNTPATHTSTMLTFIYVQFEV